MAEPKNYDLKRQTLCCMGLLIDSGFAEDDVFTLARNSPIFTRKVGADGQVTRSKTNDNSGMITIKLLQSSEANALLSAFAILDSKGNNGLGVGPLIVKDLDGTTLISGTCWVEKWPDLTLGKEASEREWQLGCDIDFMLVGGN
jgi:hypothetical protein